MNASRTAGALLIAMLVTSFGRAAALPPEPNKIAALLNSSRAALGGDALDRAGVLEFEAKVTGNDLPGTGRSWQEIGGPRFAETYSTPPLLGGDGYDGTDVWNADGSGLVWVDGGQIGRALEIDQAFAGNDALWSAGHGGATVAWGGTKSAAGHDYDVLAVTPPHSVAPFEVWFDQKTHLPERTVVTIGPVSQTTTYADYRPVAGVMIPFVQHSASGDGNVNDIVITRAIPNAPDAPAHLIKPASDVHDFSIAANASQTSIPFDLADNHVYLSVMLDGKGPYRFLFDTGGLNLIDPSVAQELSASTTGVFQGSGVGSTTAPISFANVASLQIGDATLKDQLFFVAPTHAGFGVSAGQKIDGLIGFEVLARFVTTFDYGENRVILQMPGAQLPANAGVVPFVLDGKQPQFPCGISGIAGQCTLDTGARDSITLFGPFLDAHPQLVPANATAAGVNGFGLGGAAMGKLGRLRALAIGPYTIPDVVTDFTTQTSGDLVRPFTAGNVGGGIWKRFALTLDYTKQLMALLPNAAFAQPDAYERAGLFLIVKDGAFVVLDARPGTPAAQAGILKGDTIAAIDGRAASSMSLQDVRALFFGSPGTVLRVEVVGKGGLRRTVFVTLRAFV
jgi:Aspartyl protease/PDZ domain